MRIRRYAEPSAQWKSLSASDTVKRTFNLTDRAIYSLGLSSLLKLDGLNLKKNHWLKNHRYVEVLTAYIFHRCVFNNAIPYR